MIPDQDRIPDLHWFSSQHSPKRTDQMGHSQAIQTQVKSRLFFPVYKLQTKHRAFFHAWHSSHPSNSPAIKRILNSLLFNSKFQQPLEGRTPLLWINSPLKGVQICNSVILPIPLFVKPSTFDLTDCFFIKRT